GGDGGVAAAASGGGGRRGRLDHMHGRRPKRWLIRMYRRAPELRRFSEEDLARLAAEMVEADTPRRWGGQPENALVLLVFLFGFFLLLFVFDEFSPGWMRRGSGPSPLGWAV